MTDFVTRTLASSQAVGQALSSAIFRVFHNLPHKSTTSTLAHYRELVQIRFNSYSVMKAEAALDVCPICEGTGWKTLESDKVRRVTRCDCTLRSRNERLLAQARIPKRYEHCELSNFEFDGPHRSLAPARMAACKFAEEYPLDATGLLLIGSIGVGKTHLAVGIIKGLIHSKGIGCLFYDYRELLKQIQNSYNSSVQATELEVLKPVFEAEVLVLDELGAVKPTEWVWDTVSLIQSRGNPRRSYRGTHALQVARDVPHHQAGR